MNDHAADRLFKRVPKVGRCLGFTLLELVVVMIILAVLASISIVPLSGEVERQRLVQAVELISRLDARARRDTRRTGRSLTMEINRAKNQLVLSPTSSRRPRHIESLGAIEIAELRFGKRTVAGSSREIVFAVDGSSPTYALRLRGSRWSRWLAVLGRTGQCLVLESEGDVGAILSL